MIIAIMICALWCLPMRKLCLYQDVQWNHGVVSWEIEPILVMTVISIQAGSSTAELDNVQMAQQCHDLFWVWTQSPLGMLALLAHVVIHSALAPKFLSRTASEVQL